MIQATSGGPGANPPAPEAGPASASLPGTNPTTEDPFQRHDIYFFKDGNITFLVDGTLYCVHRYFFSRDSAYFSFKFSQLDIRDHEPLRTVVSLSDTERKDFDALLSVLYPENFDEHSLSYEQWRSVLHLSTRWGFASLRKLALRSVKPPTPCDQLLLARTYGVDHWVLPALSALCERTIPINLQEARQMSVEDIVLVATVREDICNHGSRTEIPSRIEEAQARISEATRNDTFPASIKWRGAVESWKPEPDSIVAVTTGPVAEADGDAGSKTAVTTSPEEDDKPGNDEHLTEAPVEPPVEDKPQEVEQQTQEVTSEDSTNDQVEEIPRESEDGATEKELKKTENQRELGDGFGADKVKLETISREEPRIAATLSEEPEAQEQTERQVRANEPAAPSSRASSITAPPPEAQVPARAAPLYWRRLTARYMSVGPAAPS